MNPVEPYLEHAFRIDPLTRSPIVEIAVESYDALFNTLDRAPFRRRDLSPDLKQFLQECSLWIPLPQPFAIEFKLSGELLDVHRQEEVVAGIRHYFAYLMQVIRSEDRLRRRKIAVFISMSFLFLTATLAVRKLLDVKGILGAFLTNGFNVGGWVFMWEAMSIAFIRRLDVNAELARLDRLVTADIRFAHEEGPRPGPGDLARSSHPVIGRG